MQQHLPCTEMSQAVNLEATQCAHRGGWVGWCFAAFRPVIGVVCTALVHLRIYAACEWIHPYPSIVEGVSGLFVMVQLP
jgi:hypothetical protein